MPPSFWNLLSKRYEILEDVITFISLCPHNKFATKRTPIYVYVYLHDAKSSHVVPFLLVY